MTVERNAASSNRILAALSEESRQSLLPGSSRVHVPSGHVLYEAGTKIANVYFVESGLVSLVKTLNDSRSVAFSAVGHEGIAPPTAIFGIERTIMESVALIPATVLCIPIEDFRALLGRDSELTRLIQRYVSAVLNRFAQTAACNAMHPVEARCAQWLLMAHDSAFRDEFPLTHDFLAGVLAVRRESVSIAANALQNSGVIWYRHGRVSVTDRRGLERAACECYLMVRRLFDDVYLGGVKIGS